MGPTRVLDCLEPHGGGRGVVGYPPTNQHFDLWNVS